VDNQVESTSSGEKLLAQTWARLCREMALEKSDTEGLACAHLPGPHRTAHAFTPFLPQIRLMLSSFLRFSPFCIKVQWARWPCHHQVLCHVVWQLYVVTALTGGTWARSWKAWNGGIRV